VDHIPGCTGDQKQNQTSTGIFGAAHCYKDGEDVLRALSFSPDNWLFNYMAMLVLIVVVRILAFIALLLRSKVKR